VDVTYPTGVTVVMGKQGRLVVPAEVRAQLGLDAGDELYLHVSGRQIVLERPADALRALQDQLADLSGKRSLVDELLAERRAEAAAE
jgi:AbrB family looped-hinge helix DNA binding protein